MWGTVTGLKPGLHGFHIHTLGDQREGCASTAGHYQPNGQHYESDAPFPRFLGDLRQVNADHAGKATVDQRGNIFDLYGDDSIVGRALVLHAEENGGARIACCTIGMAGKAQASKGKSQY